jgi:hypothetical protein
MNLNTLQSHMQKILLSEVSLEFGFKRKRMRELVKRRKRKE